MEGPKINRRDFLKAGVASAVLATLPTYGMRDAEAREVRGSKVEEPKEWQEITPEEVHKKGDNWASVDDIMAQEVPEPTPNEILGTDTGLIISKRFHRFWLFKDGKILRSGPVGTAMIRIGKDTPTGLFSVKSLEEADYSSRTYPPKDGVPNMPWAIFFNGGIAFHGTTRRMRLKHPDTGEIKDYMRLDSSHGCVNALKEDAELVRHTLKRGDKVAVLP